MGNSHFISNAIFQGTVTASRNIVAKGNVVGYAGTEYAASLDYLKLTSGEKLMESGMKLGTRSCIVWGTATLTAAMETAASNFLGAYPYPGSMYVCMATSGTAARGGGAYVRMSIAASWINMGRVV